MMKRQTVILGGGASGLAAAVVAAKRGDNVTILEKNDRVGKKLLATGNGRCNLANLNAPVYYGNPSFAREVLQNKPVSEVLRFFESIGLPTHADSAGRVYPTCNQAAAVLDVFRTQLDLLSVNTLLNVRVTGLRQQSEKWLVLTNRGEFSADRILVCCGGLAAPKLGAENAYSLLTGLGCRLITPAPALSPLETEKGPIRGLSGLRLPAVLTLCGNSEPIARTQGEVLFADYGISGVCAMQLARDAYILLKQKKAVQLFIDFSPTIGIIDQRMERLAPGSPYENEKAMCNWLDHRRSQFPIQSLLIGALPRLLRERLKETSFDKLPRMLCAYPLTVTGVRSFDQAQITQGGIDPSDFDPIDMQHRHLHGLHACGEILNVDGDCGGYNLQFAFASGILAAEAN